MKKRRFRRQAAQARVGCSGSAEVATTSLQQGCRSGLHSGLAKGPFLQRTPLAAKTHTEAPSDSLRGRARGALQVGVPQDCGRIAKVRIFRQNFGKETSSDGQNPFLLPL